MALRTIQLTLSGATQLTTNANRLPIRQALFYPAAADYYIGTSDVDSTHGLLVKSTNTVPTVIGPFSGDAPVATNEIYLKGTDSNVVQVLLITH